MKYDLFLFDADDTLFDFQKSEALAFQKAMIALGIEVNFDAIFSRYREESAKLWGQLERGQINKDFLKTERFLRTFEHFSIDVSPAQASSTYLDLLPETIVLIDGAVEICALLSRSAEIGIITNGIESVQRRRLKNSALAPFVSFMTVSEECGFTKPDVRFFDYSARQAKTFKKERALVIGDRLETDIQGAHNFGVDSCWFNPNGLPTHGNPSAIRAKFEIRKLIELSSIAKTCGS